MDELGLRCQQGDDGGGDPASLVLAAARAGDADALELALRRFVSAVVGVGRPFSPWHAQHLGQALK